MANDLEKILEHLATPASWLRVLFVLGFCVILYLAGLVVLALTLAQALFSLFTGGDNYNLRRLGAAIADYIRQLLLYITYNTEQRPFPFAPFPEVEDSSPDVEDSSSPVEDSSSASKMADEDAAPVTAKARAPRKKTSSRKRAAKPKNSNKPDKPLNGNGKDNTEDQH